MRIRSLILGTLVSSLPGWAQAPQLDPQLPVYQKRTEIQGLHAVGSDTLANAISYWSEAFAQLYPGNKVAGEAQGSATAPPALIDGRANLGPMSRPMKKEEVAAFKAKKGYEPTAVVVGLDAIAIFVPRENPLSSLTFDQLEGIYAPKPRKGEHLTAWGQLGVKGPLAQAPIKVFGRNAKSGTYGYFQEHVLGKGPFVNSYQEQEDSLSLAFAVVGDPAAIGYTGLGHLGDAGTSLKALPISAQAGGPAVPPLPAHILDGSYPISRSLFIYVDRAPGKPLPSLVQEFLRFALSREGQEILARQGFVPLSAARAQAELKKLE